MLLWVYYTSDCVFSCDGKAKGSRESLLKGSRQDKPKRFRDPCMQEEILYRDEISSPRTRNRFDGRVLSWPGGQDRPLIKLQPWEHMPSLSPKFAGSTGL